MKKRFLLFGLIFALTAVTSQAQIYEMFSQDFESGSTVNYTVSNSPMMATQGTIYSGGSRAMKITSDQDSVNILTLDTIDFSQNATFNYYTLEFQHIAFIAPLAMLDPYTICKIEVKRPDQTVWTPLSSTHYNMTEGGSSEFTYTASFSQESYTDWSNATVASNQLWKSERFDLDYLFQEVAPMNRQLIIRFVVTQRSWPNSADGWYLDDIKVRASSQQIVAPVIQMRAFPDYINYPSSRGAKLVADITTTALQGINGDSVFCEYRVGDRTTMDTTYLHRQAPNSNRFVGRIPYYGYDTIMTWHIVAKDSTNNANTRTYPKNSSQWKRYRCVRGKNNTSQPSLLGMSSSTAFPFPTYADNRSEFVYDSSQMAMMGFGPGYITNFRMILVNSPQNVTRPRLQFRLANQPQSITRTAANTTYTEDMQILYDGSFTIEQAAAGSYKMITLQDTFFYGGANLVVQTYYDGNAEVQSTPVRHIPTSSTNFQSLFLAGFEGTYNFNAFGADAVNFNAGNTSPTRPWVQFYETQNVPLIYDAGVAALAYPSYDTPCNMGTDSVVVWLKNYGDSILNGTTIYYSVDNGAPVSYEWTGSLNGGDSTRVVVSTTQNFTIGYHTISAWTSGMLDSRHHDYIDHEPYNDTAATPFAACNGPYSGTLTIGSSSTNDFTTLERCLYVLSRCGIDAPTTVKLPLGNYGITSFPFIPGTSETNYVQFEPATANGVVNFRRPRLGVNTNAPSLVDISQAHSVRFKNINFYNGRYSDNRCNTLVLTGNNTLNCQFLNCTFADSNTAALSSQALLRANGASGTLVQNCTFYGGIIGADVAGPAPDNRASGNTIQYCDFSNQVNTAIRVVNQNGVWVDSNFANDVLTNTSYIILGQYCYQGSKITRNKVFSSKGACCIGVSDMHGTSSEYCIVANNMIVSADDGTSNLLTTPLNIIKGSYIKTVFNSVRMNAPDRVNIAAATFGGDVITNSYFQNNVIATFDTSNYAFSFIPGDNTDNLHVDHNCYYSVSGVLNKLSGINYTNLNSWRNAVPYDMGSVTGNPNYTNGSVSRVDLRSFNTLLRNVGTPIPEVTIDLFGSPRNATAPSLGAYEVTALTVDFKPIGFVTPMENYCGASSSIPVEVIVTNTGTGNYTYSTTSPITVYYSIDNGPVQSFVMNQNFGPSDTLSYLSTRTMSLPSGAGNTDLVYNIKWWVKCNQDPDDLNDTATWTVNSRYAAPAPTIINQNVNYNTVATITPTAGVNTWPVSYYTSGNGRQQRSGISWYYDDSDSTKFYYGPTLTTTPIYDDTTFYISQKRNLPLVKITEVQVSRTAAGATNPIPSWMNSSTFAIELTNCGDYPANLEGDSVIVVQATAAAKVWVLPAVTIQPGENLVLQFRTSSTATDSTRTICAPSSAVVSPVYTANFGVIYRDGHGIADAVPFNGVITAPSSQAINWNNQSIPAAVWSGSAIDLARNGGTANTPTAGARRISWPTNSTSGAPTATATLWQVATATNLMQMGETESNLIRYFDNGCEGARAAVNLHVINRPVCDLAVDEPVVDTGCNLGTEEPITVTVHNYGSQTSSDVILKYSLDGGTTVACTDTLPGLTSLSEVTHTFSNTLNMHAGADTVFNIKVWVDAVSGDVARANDTSTIAAISHYSPELPYVVSPRDVAYGDTLVLSAIGNPATDWVAWYDASHNPMGITSGSIATPYIYHPDTFYYKAVALKTIQVQLGTQATVITNNYPSPYSPKTRYVKEQYLYTAEQIAAAGHGAGRISSLAFYLNSVTTSSFTFDYYTIKMGTTPNTTFANGTYLTGLTQVYSANNLTFTPDNVGWVTHELDSDFVWDGTSSIVIEITRALSTAGIANASSTTFTAQPNTVITKQHASTDQAAQASGTRGNNRPDMLLGFLEPVGCESAEGTVFVHVTGVPDNDATFAWDDDSTGTGNTQGVFSSCDTTVVYARITNMGNDTIRDYTLRYKIDDEAWQETTGSLSNLTLSYSARVELLRTHFTPGRHTITAVVNVAGDTIPTNDTIFRSINVRFCAGEYVVGSCLGTDFPDLSTAIDTLHNAGVSGPIVFRLCPQAFDEQISIGNVPGADATNTITFKTVAGANQHAVITYAPSNTANYVMNINSSNYITFDSVDFYAYYTSGSGNNIYANVLQIDGSTNIAFRHSELRSKATTASSSNANVVFLGDENRYITFDHCVIDSGYYGIRTKLNVYSNNITISNSEISNFWFQGVYLRNVDTVAVMANNIHSGVASNGKALTGIYLASINRASVQRNFVTLIDQATGGKRGIVLNKCRGTNMDRVMVYNNMISLNGTGVASLASSGIWVDSLCRHVNVYYNTARLYAGATQAATRTFSCQNSSSVHVLNNIFENASKGYAYYVAVDTCVSSSNFNVYYSNSDTNAAGARNFARWGASNCTYIDSLRAVNGKDMNSYEAYIFFENAPYDLRCRTAQFADRAQYNPDVTLDVYGNIRPQIPQPTIGAHEFNAQRVMHDVAVAKIYLPYVPAVTTGNNPTVLNIETDSIEVLVNFFNNGNAAETCTWYAYMGNVSPTPISASQTITIGVQDSALCSVMVPSPLGIVDTQEIVVVIDINGTPDANPLDNRDTAEVFIYPAYDLQVTAVALDSTVDPNHCRMFATPIRYTIKNAGKKDFPADYQFALGYDYYCYQPNNLSMPNFPGSNTCAPITWGTILPVGITRDTVIAPDCRPNLYPTGYLQDITVRLRGWVSHEFDIKPHNDTSNYINFTSNHTPDMPFPSDTSIDYGSYGNLWATQSENRIIRWHRDDTVSGAFFYNGNNNYLRSTHWSNTPQYFHDSCYYLSAVSSRGCTSYYSQICVTVNPPLTYDVSISKVVSPRATGRVYVENDTVTLQVVNYGTAEITTVPIHFEWLSANGRTILDSITDTVHINMANHGHNGLRGRVGDNCDTFNFSFPHLLAINQPLSNTTYQLNAWVMHPNDQQRGNDTLRTFHTFRTLAESTYDSINRLAPSEVTGFDISRVSFNELDNVMPDMIGYDNLWLGSYNPGSAEVPTLVVRKGTTDTLTIEVANNQNEMDTTTPASLFVVIDYNRDGQFNFDNYENILMARGLTVTKGVKVRSRRAFKKAITIPPDSAQYGYMRMLVMVDADSTTFINGRTSTQLLNGQLQQYMIYVTEDIHLDTVDAALTRVASPRNHIVTASTQQVSVMLANKGLTPLTSATIDYSFDDHFHETQTGSVAWTGNLDPGQSELVQLNPVDFYKGTTDLTATVSVPGDTFHVTNNTLIYQYHLYDTIELRFIDSFDQTIDKWYVPVGYNNFTRNYFVRATPAKSTISSAYSQPNAYVTNATETVVTGKHGNRSVIYTPIISIRQIRPDTITLKLSKNMAEGSYLWLEYRDFSGNWVKVDDPSIRWNAPDERPDYHWYDEENGWTGTSINGAYTSHVLASMPISGEFGQDLQFRFVYTTPVSASPAAAFGDGVAIDNFAIGRARRPRDIGITQITYPTDPQFGQTIYPRVMVHNYGTDTISEFQVQYRPYGAYLYILDTARLDYDHRLVPDTSIEYTFNHPFVITNLFPDTFQICATTTLSGDIYNDNDSVCDMFALAPLQNDLYLYDVTSPLDHAVAGDSINITLRLRNFGQVGIDSCRVFYSYNGADPVVEFINFNDYLGRPLASTEFFNYTFKHRERATMGTMQLETWCYYEDDTYPYNDTIRKSIAGLTNVMDISATAGIIDRRDHLITRFSIVLDNVGGLVANNFTVGFWYDRDTNTRFTETFYREHGLPSGGHAVHTFSWDTAGREAAWNYLTVFVSVPGDVNSDNDTSTIIQDYYTDLSIDAVEIEENMSDSCRLRAVVTNHSNINYIGVMRIVMYINGYEGIRYNVAALDYDIAPGETRRIPITDALGNWKKIPKSPTRTYNGTATLDHISDDRDESNNQTTIMRVLNYFEDIPVVEETDFVLEQNYPNPFDGTTRIEFALPTAGSTRFFVTDVVGRLVYEEVKEYSNGRHTIAFDKGNLPAGVYYYGVEFDGKRRMHKMIIQ